MKYISGEISDLLTAYTCEHSRFQDKRDYISLSGAVLPVEEIMYRYEKGYEADTTARLKCYKGYQMEAGLMKRISTVFADSVSPSYEISYADGLLKGHPDFKFHKDPADCKSVLKDDWLPVSGNILPKRIYWQMQAYMLYGKMQYGGHDRGLVIFESRESGLIRDYWIRSNQFIQREIEYKFNQVILRIAA